MPYGVMAIFHDPSYSINRCSFLFCIRSNIQEPSFPFCTDPVLRFIRTDPVLRFIRTDPVLRFIRTDPSPYQIGRI